MRNPILDEVRRIRTQLAREWAENPDRDYVAESREILLTTRDPVIDENGRTYYVTNPKKLHDVLTAMHLAKEAARSKSRARRRRSKDGNSQSKNALHSRG